MLGTSSNDRPKAAQAAAGWGGDRIGIVSDSAGTEVVVWKQAWDSEKDAAEFFDVYQEVLKQRLRKSKLNLLSL